MSVYFLDTSALAKRYIPEIGSEWIVGWIEPDFHNTILISELATVEFISVIMRREREGHISSSNRLKLQNDFLFHVQQQYVMIELDSDVLMMARELLVKHPLRALDALQLASAVQASISLDIEPIFVSGDVRLLEAAAAEDFEVENPNEHL